MGRFVSLFVRAFIRWMPDAFTVTLLLTILTFFLAVTVAGYSPRASVVAWGDGFWSLLEFTNQITLTLLLGYVLANTPPVRKLLLSAAGLARTPASAYVLGCFITGACSLISWGLGLITAGIMARAIGESCRRKGIAVHYPLLVASSFSGFVIWHQGLTSSIGLALASSSSFLADEIGVISTSETLFTSWNVGLALFVLLTLPFVMAAVRPRDASQIEEIPDRLVHEDDGEPPRETEEEPTPASRMENSWISTACIVAVGGVYIAINLFPLNRFLELDRINFAFLILGMLLAGSPIRFIGIVAEGGRVAAPLLVYYPFYAGIKGVMADSGLAQMVVEFFVSISNVDTLPLFGFLSGGLVNLFIPSGGGQWAVQGPIMVAAAQAIGTDIPRVAMSVALGDQWTNLIQPLVLIPVLLIAGIKARQIMGYMFVAVVWSGLAFSAALSFF